MTAIWKLRYLIADYILYPEVQACSAKINKDNNCFTETLQQANLNFGVDEEGVPVQCYQFCDSKRYKEYRIVSFSR